MFMSIVIITIMKEFKAILHELAIMMISAALIA